MNVLVGLLVLLSGVGCASSRTDSPLGATGSELERGPAQVSDICERLKAGGYFFADEGFPYFAKKSRFPSIRISRIAKIRGAGCAYYELALESSGVYLNDKPLTNESHKFVLDVPATNLAFDKLKANDTVAFTLVSGAGVIANMPE